MYFRPIAGDDPTSGGSVRFGLPFGSTYTLAFSRILYDREVLVAYNVSASARRDLVLIDGELHATGDTLRFLYGWTGTVAVQTAPGNTRSCGLTWPTPIHRARIGVQCNCHIKQLLRCDRATEI